MSDEVKTETKGKSVVTAMAVALVLAGYTVTNEVTFTDEDKDRIIRAEVSTTSVPAEMHIIIDSSLKGKYEKIFSVSSLHFIDVFVKKGEVVKITLSGAVNQVTKRSTVECRIRDNSKIVSKDTRVVRVGDDPGTVVDCKHNG